MNWRPIQTLLLIVVTSVTANQKEANCDCSKQGPWHPVFKPSQILHSEFPEHRHSSITGGPKPTPSKIKKYKLVPHLVVPLVNPLAFSIQQHDNHLHEGYQGKTPVLPVKLLPVRQHKVKEVHYHYNFPHPNDPNSHDSQKYHHNTNADPTPSSPEVQDNNLENQEDLQNHNYDDGYYGQNHSQDHQDYQAPDHIPPSGDGHSQEENYSQEEDLGNQYYGNSQEHNDHMYDSSKPYPVYEQLYSQYSDGKSNKPVYSYYYRNEFFIPEKYRGKSMNFRPFKSGLEHVHYHHTPPEGHNDRPHKDQKSASETFKSEFRHSSSLPPPTPIQNPPMTFYNPWRVWIREEARKMSSMRPPAPGLSDPWTNPVSSSPNVSKKDSGPRIIKIIRRSTLSL